MTLYIFHGGCHTGRGHLDANRRDTAALLWPLSCMTAMMAFCCAGAATPPGAAAAAVGTGPTPGPTAMRAPAVLLAAEAVEVCLQPQQVDDCGNQIWAAAENTSQPPHFLFATQYSGHCQHTLVLLVWSQSVWPAVFWTQVLVLLGVLPAQTAAVVPPVVH